MGCTNDRSVDLWDCCSVHFLDGAYSVRTSSMAGVAVGSVDHTSSSALRGISQLSCDCRIESSLFGHSLNAALGGRSHGIYQLSEIREALFDTTAVFCVKCGAANATPHLRGLYLASVARFAQLIATWYGAEELASRAMLFLETPCERRPAIASPDVGQRARSKSSIRP